MNGRPHHLPDFAQPPVSEVVLGVQFERIPQFLTVHSGFLWHKFRTEFPKVQQQPPLEPTFETFGTRQNAGGVELRFSSGPPPIPRLWFLNEDDSELIQFQPDRFLHNWRKRGDSGSYPRYEKIKDRFLNELEILQAFLSSENLGELKPNQIEVTYVNHIISPDGEDLCSNPSKVFNFFGDSVTSDSFGNFENGQFQLRFTLQNAERGPFGRLYVDAQPGWTREEKPVIILTITAKGAPTEPTIEAASDFMDFGREKIVQGFDELTTAEMHERWGKAQ